MRKIDSFELIQTPTTQSYAIIKWFFHIISSSRSLLHFFDEQKHTNDSKSTSAREASRRNKKKLNNEKVPKKNREPKPKTKEIKFFSDFLPILFSREVNERVNCEVTLLN